jgi:small-conductance mechanosensitive channel
MWVQARQYTGRIVTVTNDKIFENPVYNYSRDFPYIWEELRVGVSYDADKAVPSRFSSKLRTVIQNVQLT